MKIREKALAAFVLSCAVIATVSVQTLNVVINRYFSLAETDSIERRAKSAKALLEAEIERLKAAVASKGNWSDLRYAVFKRTGRHLEESAIQRLDAEAFFNHNFHLREQRSTGRTGTLVFDIDRNILHATELSNESTTIVPLQSEKKRKILETLSTAGDFDFSGFVRFDDGNYAALVAASIRDNLASAEPAGSIVYFKEFYDSDFVIFSQRLGFDFHVEEAKVPDLFGGNKPKLQESKTLSGMAKANSAAGEREKLLSTVAAFDLSSGRNGQAPRVTELPLFMRKMFEKQRDSILNAVGIYGVLLSLIFGFIVYFMSLRWLVRPAEDLCEQIDHLAELKNAGERIVIPEKQSSEEYVLIARSINNLVEKIEKQDQTLREKERLALLGTMQAEFAHEVSNPIGVINSSVRRLKKTLADPAVIEENWKHFERIEKICGFLSKLLNSFRTASRAGAGAANAAVDLEEFELSELVSIAEVIGNVKAKMAMVSLSFEAISSSYKMKTDKTKLLQVINNLISNGVDAAAASESKKVSVSVAAIQNSVVFRVVDSGSGLPPQIKQRLFEKFATSKSSSAGTGLGLSLSWEIMKKLGGELRFVEGEEQTTFELVCPNETVIKVSA